MKLLPDDVKLYKRTCIFTEQSVPQGFLKNHSTKENVWGLLRVIEGRLEYTIGTDETYILESGKDGVIEQRVHHYIRPLGEVKFFVEFYKKS